MTIKQCSSVACPFTRAKRDQIQHLQCFLKKSTQYVSYMIHSCAVVAAVHTCAFSREEPGFSALFASRAKLSKVERLSAFGYSHALIIKPHHLASCFVGHMLFVPRALWLLYYVSLWQSRPSSQALGTPCAVEWLIALRHEDPLMVSPWHCPILQLRSHPFQNSKEWNWKAKLTDMPIGLRGDWKHTCMHADYMSSVHMAFFLRLKKERGKSGKKVRKY